MPTQETLRQSKADLTLSLVGSLFLSLGPGAHNAFFFPFIFISWRLITLQYCGGFCHTLT